MIRPAKWEDIPRILELLVQVDMVHHRGRPDIFKGPATKYNEEELEKIIRQEDTPVFVYVEDKEPDVGKVLGHAFCMHKQILGDSVLTDIKTLYVDDICVDEACRGKGVGRALYDYVLDYARREGFYNLTLNVWACNPEAMKFYEAMGLKPQKVGMETLL